MERLRIQQKICDVVTASNFYEVFYTPGTGKPIDRDPAALSIQPDSVRTNELSGRYEVDKQYGIKEILKQVTWTFCLFLEWNNKEVDLSDFEANLMINIPFVAKSGDRFFGQGNFQQ